MSIFPEIKFEDSDLIKIKLKQELDSLYEKKTARRNEIIQTLIPALESELRAVDEDIRKIAQIKTDSLVDTFHKAIKEQVQAVSVDIPEMASDKSDEDKLAYLLGKL